MPEEEDVIFGVHTSRHPKKGVSPAAERSEHARRIVAGLRQIEAEQKLYQESHLLMLEMLQAAARRVDVEIHHPLLRSDRTLEDILILENSEEYSKLVLKLVDAITVSPKYPKELNSVDRQLLRELMLHIMRFDGTVIESISGIGEEQFAKMFLGSHTNAEIEASLFDNPEKVGRVALDAFGQEQQVQQNVDALVGEDKNKILLEQAERIQTIIREQLNSTLSRSPSGITEDLRPTSSLANELAVSAQQRQSKSSSKQLAEKINRRYAMMEETNNKPTSNATSASHKEVALRNSMWHEHQKRVAEDKARELDRSQRIRTAMEFYGQNLPALQELFASDFEFLYTDSLIERIHQMRLENGYYDNPHDESTPRFIDGLHETGVLVDIESPEVCNLHAVAVRVALIEKLKSELSTSRLKRRYKTYESDTVLDMEVLGAEIVATSANNDRGYVALVDGDGYSFGYWFDVNDKKLIGGRKELDTIDGSPIHFGFVAHRSGDDKKLFLPLVSSIKPLTGCNVVFSFGQEVDEKKYNKPALLSKVRQLCEAIKNQRNIDIEMTSLAFYIMTAEEKLKRDDASLEYIHMILSLIGESQQDIDTTLFQLFSSSQLKERQTIMNEDGQPQEVVVVARGASVYEQVGNDMHKMEYFVTKAPQTIVKNIKVQTFTVFGGLASDVYGRDSKKYPRYRVVGDEFGRVWFYKLGADFETPIAATPEQYGSLKEMFGIVDNNEIGNESGIK